MVRMDRIDIPPDEVGEIYFSDNRVRRVLRSIRNVNSSVALPSIVLLLPILIGLLAPDSDRTVLLSLGVLPAVVVCQASALLAAKTDKTRSVPLLKACVPVAVVCSILGILGLTSIIALITLISKYCSWVTCITDLICSSILGLMTALGVVYNLVHSRVLTKAIWHNPVLLERAMTMDLMDVDPEPASLGTISETLDYDNASSEGFSYSRMYDNPTEVFP